MSDAYTGESACGAIRYESGNAAALGAADWLSLAAAPTFAIMALLSGTLGGGASDMLCSAARDASPLSGMVIGMVPMYLLMSVFHSAPWLKLLSNMERAMKIKLVQGVITISLVGISAAPSRATETTIEQMPAKLEMQFALSALPPALRDQATVYLLDPKKGYQLSRQGTSGVTCLVERTVWEWVDFRNDIYIPLCYDAVGTKAHLKVIVDTATLRARGMSPVALKAEIENRYMSKTYIAPEKPGLTYMVAPVMRALGPPDMKMHTMSMPHLMFYAPNVMNEDIGAVPDLSVPSSLLYPFIDTQGIAEQSYMIQLIGEAEKAKIMADEKTLLDDLCAYRDVLCLPNMKH